MPKKPKENLAIREAELKKIEDLNRREKKALEEKAELVRQKRELDAAEDEPETTPHEGAPLFGYADAGFMDVIQKLSEEGMVHVYRMTNGALKKVSAFPVTDLEALEQQMEKIAHDYGGGSFTLRILSPGGQIAKTKILSFDELAYSKAADPSAQASHVQDRMIQLMVESNRQTTELFKTFLLAQAQNKPASPFGNMTVADIIALLKGNSGPVDFKSMSDLFTRALTMGREIAEGKPPTEPGGEDNMLKDLVSPFLAVLQNITTKRPAQALPAPVVPARTAVPPAVQPPAPTAASSPAASAEIVSPDIKEEIPVDSWTKSVKSSLAYKLYVPSVLKAAREKAEPAGVAEDILNTVPETHHGLLLKLMESPDVVDYLSAFEPEAKDHAEWIKAVAAEIVSQFEDGGEGGEEDMPEAPSPSGNGHSEKLPPDVSRVPAGA